MKVVIISIMTIYFYIVNLSFIGNVGFQFDKLPMYFTEAKSPSKNGKYVYEAFREITTIVWIIWHTH